MNPNLVIRILQTEKLSGEEKRVLMSVVALMEVEQHGQLTGKEIGKVSQMTQPSVSATLKGLVDGDFLTKENAPRGNLKVYGYGKKLTPFLDQYSDDE